MLKKWGLLAHNSHNSHNSHNRPMGPMGPWTPNKNSFCCFSKRSTGGWLKIFNYGVYMICCFFNEIQLNSIIFMMFVNILHIFEKKWMRFWYFLKNVKKCQKMSKVVKMLKKNIFLLWRALPQAPFPQPKCTFFVKNVKNCQKMTKLSKLITFD